VLSMMCKFILVKVGGSEKTKMNENGRGEESTNFAEIGGIWNMHHCLGEMDTPASDDISVEFLLVLVSCNHICRYPFQWRSFGTVIFS